ncbi:MAG: HAMP domain-containing sensor histidine kinase [Pseudomonadota bacterium]|nr:HAMP domain-containing sensor histidine kinase [Pseudomonadota bacterium]
MTTLKQKRRHSLSGKLILLFIVMAFAFVLLVSGGIRHAFQGHFKDNIQPHITQYLEYVSADIGTPPDRSRAQELADRLNLEIQIIDNKGHWSSSGRLSTMDDLEIERSFLVNGKQYFHAEDEQEHYLMARDGETTLLFNVPNVRDQRKGFKGWYPIIILLFLLLLLYYATRRLFAPLDTIQQGVQKFGAGYMDHRIQLKRKDELGELANSFNTMADDIQQMLDAKRQLLLAISHELRSPLTRMRVAVELLDEDDKKAQLVQDINEMESLIEELMETERLSSRHTKLNKAQVDIVELVNEVVAANFYDAGITVDLPETSLKLDVDAARIKLLLKNLLDNAVRHTPEITRVPEIQLTVDKQKVLIKVSDHGNGIEAMHLPHLTEPFYRVDSSRQRETGGYGLGLYLCRMIVEAHDGELQIESEAGKGTQVTVKLPL